jgi:hypothetical protein
MFGGLPPDAEQPKSVRRGFTRRADMSSSPAHGHFKAISRTRCVDQLGVHQHKMSLLCKLLRLPAFPIDLPLPLLWRYPTANRRYPPWPDESYLADAVAAPLHLNHYPVQSLKWFLKTKVGRGEASAEAGAAFDNYRNRAYYEAYNRTDLLDEGLARIARSALDEAGRHPLGRCPGEGHTTTRRHVTPHHITPHYTTPHHTTNHSTSHHNTAQHNNTTQHYTTQRLTTQR